MKHNDAKALVEAMFGNKGQGMISPNVQKAYCDAFGSYPPSPKKDLKNSFWAERFREIADALVNRCSECLGSAVVPDNTLNSCIQQEPDIVIRIKSILKQFGIKDSDKYVQATIYLDYEKALVGVSMKKKMSCYSGD